MLMFSPLQSFAQFGNALAITIAYALIVSILVVPPVMTVWDAYQNMRMRSMVERLWDEVDVAIEDTHRRHDQGQAWSQTPNPGKVSDAWGLDFAECRGGQVTRLAQGDLLRELLTAGGLDLGARVAVVQRVDAHTSV